MLRHERKLHVTSLTPPRSGGDSMEGTTLPPLICDSVSTLHIACALSTEYQFDFLVT